MSGYNGDNSLRSRLRPATSPIVLGIVVLAGCLLVGCGNSAGRSTTGATATGGSTTWKGVPLAAVRKVAEDVGPKAPVGSTPGDHWHGAYGIYVCGKYLPPVDGSNFEDPDGIHTHADGLIHIHPFTATAAGRNATLGKFLAAAKITVTSDELAFPNTDGTTTTYRNGAQCVDGSVGHVGVVTFAGKNARPREVADPATWHLEQGQLFAFVFAADAAKIPAPPSADELSDPTDVAYRVSDAEAKALGPVPPRPDIANGEPPTAVQVKEISAGGGATVGANSKVSFVYTLSTWSDRKLRASSWPDTSTTGTAALLSAPTIAIGSGHALAWLETGLLGMRVGGTRQVVIPASIAGSTSQQTGIDPGETLVLWLKVLQVR